MLRNAIPLAYARAPRRRWRIVRYLVWVLILAASWSLWHWWPPIREWVRVMSWQRTLERYSQPADRIAFTTEPAEAARLRRQAGYQQFDDVVWYASQVDSIIDQARPTFTYPSTTAPSAYWPSHYGAIFLHERRTPGGGKRLVVAYVPTSFRAAWGLYEPTDEMACPPLYVECSVYDVTWHGPVVLRQWWSSSLAVAGDRSGAGITFYAGQPDSADETHFTIGYRHTGKTGTIDGWLRDDDSVILAPREGRWGTVYATSHPRGRPTTSPSAHYPVWCPPGWVWPQSEFDQPLMPVLARPQ